MKKIIKKLFKPNRLNYFRETFKNPRWGYGKPAHPLLHQIINEKRDDYIKSLSLFLNYKDRFLAISKNQGSSPNEPHQDNVWLPGLDSFALYCFLNILKPARYIEVGSGNSTKFARRSITDHNLKTTITSIDPQPRAEIDNICTKVIRKPVEDVDLTLFEQLEENDILFIDNSHRCFMNSDVTTVFLDIIPRLKPGVVVEIHDIFLPNDYPPHWGERYYSEQYLLAAYLLANGNKIETLLPNAFISGDSELREILKPIYTDDRWCGEKFGGGSFWFRIS